MKTDISTQLRNYGEFLDDTARHVDVERLEELADRAVLQPVRPRHNRPGWAVAAGTAVATLLIIGSVALLRSGDSRPATGGGPLPVLDLKEIPPFYAKVSAAQQGVTMVYELWYQGEAGWRLTSLERQGDGEFFPPGGYEVWTGDVQGRYNPDTHTTETFSGYSNPLVDAGLAAIAWDDFTQDCEPLGPAEQVGRFVNRYGCVDDELWYDQNSGLMLKRLGGDVTHEILEVQLNPEFPDGIFTFDPPADAVDFESQGTGFEHLLVGQPAPSLAGELLGGGTFGLTESLGQPVVVTFWYSECQPCHDHLDVLHKVAPERADIVFVTALVEDTASDAQLVITERGYTLPVLDTPASQPYADEDRNGPYGILLGVPTTVFVNSDGTIAAVFGWINNADAYQSIFDQAGW